MIHYVWNDVAVLIVQLHANKQSRPWFFLINFNFIIPMSFDILICNCCFPFNNFFRTVFYFFRSLRELNFCQRRLILNQTANLVSRKICFLKRLTFSKVHYFNERNWEISILRDNWCKKHHRWLEGVVLGKGIVLK